MSPKIGGHSWFAGGLQKVTMTIAAGVHAVMVPMLPLHLATTMPTASTPTPVFGEPRESVIQVLAAEDLPLGVFSAEFAAEELLKVDNAEDRRFQVRLSSGGKLVCDNGEDCSWIAATQLADDVHSCNVLLQFCPSHLQRLTIRTVRHLKRGQELLLWFSEELLVPLNLPFLLPANIQGEKRYVCHICRRLFEAPNPLKVHLALNCDSQSLRHFWRRLVRPASPSPHAPSPPQLIPSTRGAFRPYEPSPNTTRAATPKSTKSYHDSPLYFSSHLAFPSFRLPSDGLPLQPFFLHPPVDLNPVTPAPIPSSPIRQPERNHQLPVPSISSYHQHATDMETLVSNLGTSKQGHLCIYCGKVYSRKYGLKIHIRTHTGFKPLRCKYCLRPFGDPSNLNKHVRLHAEGKTPYKCTLCGKVLVRRRDLERHVKSRHSGQSIDGEEELSDSADIETDELCQIEDIKDGKEKLD